MSKLKRTLFQTLNVPFEALDPNIDENIYDNLPVDVRVVRLAESKVEVLTRQYKDSIIIGSDVLTSDQSGRVYTKLRDGGDAINEIMKLSGKTIDVHTGCTVYVPRKGYHSIYVKSVIFYREFTEQAIMRIMANDDSSIRSGLLGVYYDAPGFPLIEHIDGSYTGAMGLPLEFVGKFFD